MSDWRDDLKNRNKDGEEHAASFEELRLHESKIIRARLPDLWKIVIEQVRTDCSKLVKTFPREEKYHCFMEPTTNGFQITSGKLPFHILEAELDLDGQYISIKEGMKYNRSSLPIFDRTMTRIEVEVSKNDELELHYLGKTHIAPETLCKQLISIVCGFRI